MRMGADTLAQPSFCPCQPQCTSGYVGLSIIPYLPAWIRVLYNCTVKSVLDQNVIDAIMYQHTVQLTPYYNVTVSFVSTAGTQIPVLPKNLNNCWRGERAASSGERRRAGVREKTCALGGEFLLRCCISSGRGFSLSLSYILSF